MSESRIVVETECEHGENLSHAYFKPDPENRPNYYEPGCPGRRRTIIDPENLPAEVIEAAARAVEQYGVYDHSESVGKAALSAAFRTLGEILAIPDTEEKT